MKPLREDQLSFSVREMDAHPVARGYLEAHMRALESQREAASGMDALTSAFKSLGGSTPWMN